MRIGMTGQMVGGGLSAKDYVQDGLYALYDGIENIGYGKHSNSPSAWKELSGNYNDAIPHISRAFTWEDDGCVFNGGAYTTQGNIDSFPKATLEIVTSNASIRSSNQTPFGCTESGGWVFSYRSAGKLILYVAKQDLSYITIDGGSYVGNNSFSFSYENNGKVKLYKNGVFVSENSLTSIGHKYTGIPVLMGADPNGTTAIEGVYYGKVNCARIYSAVLSSSEIAANYAIDKARFGLT